MQVSIPKAVFQAFAKQLRVKPFNIAAKELEWRDHLDLNLALYTPEALLALETELAARPDIRGVKTLCRDIKAWAAASADKAGAAGTKARTLKQMESLLIEYIRHSPHKHLYKRLQEADEGVSLCYYVDGIEWHPARRDYYEPAYIRMTLLYEVFGLVQRETHNFYAGNAEGKTAAACLQSGGYLLETLPLRGDYEFFVDRYAQLKDQIGLQCLAVGLADDEGIDGNDEGRDSWYMSSRKAKFILGASGGPARVVVDVFREEAEEDREKHVEPHTYFWKRGRKITDDDDDVEYEIDDEELPPPEIPIHPYVAAFDLKRHKRLRIHAGNLTPYEYDTKIRDSLVLPEDNTRLIDTLLVEKESKFRDIVAGKSGGIIILCQGAPGTGKTLTAEIYAEALGRALYTVQCSQLGTDPEVLEDNLMKVLARGRRWGAVMLLDEADVYVHQRGNDLAQNAIVGVFLRVLEYHSGVLFLTTNRGDLVDDAILSRCTARIPYTVPPPEDQERIWRVLAAANEISLPDEAIREIVGLHDRLSGRDIKNLLKLAAMVAAGDGRAIDADLITEMKRFKPTIDGAEEEAGLYA